ncbi:MAG: copper chaperone CopZ [Sphingobacteriales bacterium]|jgi:copper chaperone CopZ
MRSFTIFGGLIILVGLLASCSTSNQLGGQFLVAGNCGMCTNNIQTAALSEPGVKKAKYQLDKNLLQLQFDSSKTSLENIQKRVAESGYSTALFYRDSTAHANLPACCQRPEK